MAQIRALRRRVWLLAALLAFSLRGWPARIGLRSRGPAPVPGLASVHQGRRRPVTVALGAYFPYVAVVRAPRTVPAPSGPLAYASPLFPAGGFTKTATSTTHRHRSGSSCKISNPNTAVVPPPPPATTFNGCAGSPTACEHPTTTGVSHTITYTHVSHTIVIVGPIYTTGYGHTCFSTPNCTGPFPTA